MKRILALLVLALTLISLACAPKRQLPAWSPSPTKTPSITLHADPLFTDEERSVLDTSASIWRIQTSGLADIKIVYDYDPDKHEKEAKIRRVLTDSLEAFENDCDADELCRPVVLAWVAPSGGIHNPWGDPVDMVYIPERSMGRMYALQTIVHEFGHVLGMPHSNCVQSILYPRIISERKHACLRMPDLSLFCSVNKCDGFEMRPCE